MGQLAAVPRHELVQRYGEQRGAFLAALPLAQASWRCSVAGRGGKQGRQLFGVCGLSIGLWCAPPHHGWPCLQLACTLPRPACSRHGLPMPALLPSRCRSCRSLAAQDDSPVRERGPQKSLAAERSFPPLASEAAATAELAPLAQTLLARAAEVRKPCCWAARLGGCCGLAGYALHMQPCSDATSAPPQRLRKSTLCTALSLSLSLSLSLTHSLPCYRIPGSTAACRPSSWSATGRAMAPIHAASQQGCLLQRCAGCRRQQRSSGRCERQHRRVPSPQPSPPQQQQQQQQQRWWLRRWPCCGLLGHPPPGP